MSPREAIHPSTAPAPKEQPSRRAWRRPAIIAGIALAVVGLCAALLLIAPRHIARYVANHYLQGMQIDVEGVKTIDVALLKGEVSMGPVRFHAGTADPGSIGQLGVKLNLRNLFVKQALLESVVIKDVAISIRQTEHGELLINGVSLRQFLAEKAADERTPEPAEQDKQGKSAWGTGVDDLRTRNVRVHFINRYGGTADLDLEHLDLRGFRSWEPDQPGVFVLTANVNGVEVNAYGTARPFAEKITATVEVGVDGAGLQNIEQYTGPFEFERSDGTLTVYARNDLELFPEGRLNGTTNATLVFGNVDVADPSLGEVKLDQCGVTADARYGIDEAGVTTVGGKAEVKLNQADARLANGIGVALPFATLGLADLSVTLPGDGAVRLMSKSRLDADRPTLSGPADVSADKLVLDAPELRLDRDGNGTHVAAKATVNAQQLAVHLPQPAGAGDHPRVGLAAESGRLDLTDIELNSGGNGETRLDGTLQAALTGLAGSWGSATAPPVEDPRRGRTRGKPAEAAAPVAAGGRMSANDLAFGFAPLHLRTNRDGIAARGLASTTVTGLSAMVTAGPGAAPYDVAAARFRIDLADLDVASRSAESTLSGRLDATADGLVATQSAPPSTASGRVDNQTRLAADSLRVALSPLNLGSRADRLSLSAGGFTALERFTAALAKTPTKPALDVGVASARANLAEIGAELAPGGAQWRTRLDAQVADIQALGDGGKLASATVRTISIGEVRADHRLRFVVDRLVIDKPEASLTREWVATAATEESRPREAVEAAEEATRQGGTLAMNSFSVVNGGTLRYRDASVKPNANFLLDVKGLQVLNLDTGDPSQRTQFRLDGTISQYTEVAVNGWAAPFGKAPDFDLKASVRRLELPPLSPYAARAIGLNLESGRLSIDASAETDTGKLNGAFDVTLRDLGFSPLSKSEAERLSASVGVPIETLVGLLQDDQGRIRLKLPVSGDLRNPSFDFGDAIRQALAGTVQAAVLAPFQLAFAPVALIASAAGAGGSMTFNPIAFDPGTADLNSTGRDMAAALARVLRERDKLKLRVCGRATAEDLAEALGEKAPPPAGPQRDQAVARLGGSLETLASDRTAEVRRALIEEGGAKPGQVGECRSAFDPDDTRPPRVEISF